MNIIELEIEKLIPYEKNNRIHSDDQITNIATSIEKFGFNQPIIIDETNTILVGHGRLDAAKKLGLKKVPIVQLNNLSEQDKIAYRILDNKLQNDSSWDFANLEYELNKLKETDFDVSFCDLDEMFQKLGMSNLENKDIPSNNETYIDEEKFLVVIQCLNETDQKVCYDDCVDRGLKCKII